MSVNKVILVGRIGKDPECRQANSGTMICNFTMATNRKWKDKQGEQKDETEWHRLVAFGRTAEVIGEYLKKGSQVYIEGRLQTRKWQDKDGSDRWSTEVVVDVMRMLDSRGEGGEPTSQRDPEDSRSRDPYQPLPGDIPDSDVPF